MLNMFVTNTYKPKFVHPNLIKTEGKYQLFLNSDNVKTATPIMERQMRQIVEKNIQKMAADEVKNSSINFIQKYDY